MISNITFRIFKKKISIFLGGFSRQIGVKTLLTGFLCKGTLFAWSTNILKSVKLFKNR